MKKILLIITLITPFLLSAQEEKQKKNSINVVIGIAGGSSISKYYQRNKDVFINQGIPDKGYPKTISGGVNYRFGFDYQRILINRLSLKAGIRISNWNLKITDYFDEITVLNNLYFEIPIAFQYNLGQKKLKPYIEGGVNLMLGLRNSDGGGVAAHLGVGATYQLTERISLYGQLSGRAQFTPTNYRANWSSVYTVHATGKYVYLYEVGIELGAAYSF